MNIEDNLTLQLASFRSKVISKTDYEIFLDFQGGSRAYEGRTKIRFTLLEKGKDIPIDFISEQIISLKVNGKKISEIDYHHWKILLPEEFLTEGENHVEVHYKNDFDTNGVGLHRFVEDDSKAEYIFSDLEPFECHKIFPCFDQPDLKATITLSASCPKHWVLVTNSMIQSKEEDENRKHILFHTTPPLSTYVFSIVCGDFKIREFPGSKLPMRILYREAMEPFIPFQDMFQWTKESLEHFENYLGIPYPFDKYDQVFLPEFDGGAMENAGLVTFTERYLSRGKPTDSEIFELAGTVVHELAHMWFGNLVTMKWWDGLWLNEAFATYFGYAMLGKLKSFENWELYFTQEVKNRAFIQDQSSITHPIVSRCTDTNTAFANFDSITYEKAASIVRQLIFLLSEKKFQEGIHDYLKSYSYSVAELGDFLNSMQTHTDVDLKKWSQQWLETENLNTLEPVWEEQDGTITSFYLKQSAPESSPILRDHRTRLALYTRPEKGSSESILPHTLLDVFYKGASTEVKDLVGKPSPYFLYCNHSDFDYVKTYLDEKSIEDLPLMYPHFEEALTRQLIANSLWNMVLDAKFSPIAFIELALDLESKETNDTIAVFLLDSIRQTLLRFLPPMVRESQSSVLFHSALSKLRGSEENYDRKCVWFQILIQASTRLDHLEELVHFHKTGHVGTLALDIDRKWSIVKTLSYRRHLKAGKLIEEMLQFDRGDLGAKFALESNTALRKDKKDAFLEILHQKDLSSDNARAMMKAFFHRSQLEECRELLPLYFHSLMDIFHHRDRIFSRDFSSMLYPYVYPRESKTYTEELLNSQEKLPYLMRRSLLENLDEVKRHLKIQKEFFGETKLPEHKSLEKMN